MQHHRQEYHTKAGISKLLLATKCCTFSCPGVSFELSGRNFSVKTPTHCLETVRQLTTSILIDRKEMDTNSLTNLREVSQQTERFFERPSRNMRVDAKKLKACSKVFLSQAENQPKSQLNTSCLIAKIRLSVLLCALKKLVFNRRCFFDRKIFPIAPPNFHYFQFNFNTKKWICL